MILYVNGQDIKRIVLGIVGEEGAEMIEVGPDGFLGAIHAFLDKRAISLNEIKTIVCVRGPGSATALRVSLSLVQALAFAKKISLVSVEKDPSASEQEAFHRVTPSWLAQQSPVEAIVPLYAHAPQITAAKRDHLKRSI